MTFRLAVATSTATLRAIRFTSFAHSWRRAAALGPSSRTSASTNRWEPRAIGTGAALWPLDAAWSVKERAAFLVRSWTSAGISVFAAVNPPHYPGDVECIDALRAAFAL